MLTLDEDLWGRIYVIVMNKLRRGMTPVMETLDPRLVSRIVEALFLRLAAEEHRPPPPPKDGDDTPPWEWREEWGIQQRELASAVRKMDKKKAPRPDGIHSCVLVLLLGALTGRIRRLFTGCLRAGHFPPTWRQASLILLRKEADRRNPLLRLDLYAYWTRRVATGADHRSAPRPAPS